MGKDLKIMVADLKYILGKEFPNDAKTIADLRTKIEGIRKNMNESLEVIQHIEKLQQKKILMSN